MTDLSEVLHYLSTKINNNIKNKIITLCQFTYLKKMLNKYNIKSATLLKILSHQKFLIH